jgi:hypothetical protein
MKINSHIVNDVTYKHVKFHYKIHCILGYTTIKNMTQFVDLKYTYLDLHVCCFCVAQNIKYLNLIFYTFVR